MRLCEYAVLYLCSAVNAEALKARLQHEKDAEKEVHLSLCDLADRICCVSLGG